MTAAKQSFDTMLASFLSDSASVDIAKLVSQFFAESQNVDSAISADQLTALVSAVTKHDYSAKSIRANLRAKAYRDQSQFRNATWRITSTIALAEVKRYLRVA